jgi:hypothetical protein
MKTKSLRATIIDLMEHPSNTNQTGLTISPELGWRLTFSNQDREENAVMLICKESLEEWNDGHGWDDHAAELCAEWITDNAKSWLKADCATDDWTPSQWAEIFLILEGGAE